MGECDNAAAAAAVAVPIAVVTAGPASAATPPCTNDTVSACVDLSAQRAWLAEDGEVTYGPVGITSGRPGYETDRGRFTVGTRTSTT